MSGIEVWDAGGDTIQLVDVGGYRVCNFGHSAEEEGEIMRKVKDFTCRDDDVFILAPVKSGTHWVWEIASMLISGRAETIPKSKTKNMLEHETTEQLEALESPRILNTHLDIAHLPEQLFEKRCKIIHVLRNPKDTIVSFYNHVKGVRCYGYNGKWEHFLRLFLSGELDYGSWFDYVTEWEQFIKQNPDYPIHVMFYEEMQKNNIVEIKRLAEFLSLSPSDDLVKAISNKCHFDSMRQSKITPQEIIEQAFTGDFTIYRKGVVGDWKTWFTVAQNEQFDHLYKSKMSGSSLKFEYE